MLLLVDEADKEKQKNLIKAIKDHPNVMSVMVYIITKHSKEFHKTVKEIKMKISDPIKSYATFVAYKEHMFQPILNTIFS